MTTRPGLVSTPSRHCAAWQTRSVCAAGMRTAKRYQSLLTRCLHLSKGQLVDVEGRRQTRQWDDDAGLRHWKTEVVIGGLEMLSGRGKKEYAKEAQAVAATDEEGLPTSIAGEANGASDEALVAM